MMQFTTISGRNTPRLWSSAGTNAFTSICTIVTNDAITTMYAGMRAFAGITLRSAEITTLEQISTMVAAMPMPTPFTTEVEVASVGQVPSTSRSTGFSFSMPLVSS